MKNYRYILIVILTIITSNYILPQSGIILRTKLFLSSCYSDNFLRTDLSESGLIPLNQPYTGYSWNYQGNESVEKMPSEIVDWVLVELRSSVVQVVSRRAAFLNKYGYVVDLDGLNPLFFSNVTPGNYYIVVRHRNHLGIMSSEKITLNMNSELYDFTGSQDKALGNQPQQDLKDGNFGMYSGDGNLDEVVNVLDYASVGNNLSATGYRFGDIDMDGKVSSNDYKGIFLNLFKKSYAPHYVTENSPLLGDYGNFGSMPRTGNYSHVDINELISSLSELNANTYFWGIYEQNDWTDLLTFLPKANTAGISVWIYLMPPSEAPQNYVPFGQDYTSWIKAIAELSLNYSNLKGYSIDDFWLNIPGGFTLPEIETIIDKGKSINPNLKFYPLTYQGQVNAPYILNDLANKIDGLIVCYPRDSITILKIISEATPHNRACIYLPASVSTDAGDYGRITKTAFVTDPDSITFTFHYTDDFENTDYDNTHYIQLSIDSYEGDELIVNKYDRDFSTDTEFWSKGTNWTFSDGTANYSGSGWYDLTCYNLPGLIKGERYRVSYTITSISNGGVRVGLGGKWGTERTRPGTYTEEIISNGSHLVFEQSSGNSKFSIDNISVRNIGTNGIWSIDAAGIDDSTVTIDLKPFVSDRNSFNISLGVYEKSAVGNSPISAYFSNISAHGIDIDSDLTSWSDNVSKSFIVKKAGNVGKKLPVIIMEAATVSEYNVRYRDGATPGNIAARVNTAKNFATSGLTEGVTTYCLPQSKILKSITINQHIYNAVKEIYNR